MNTKRLFLLSVCLLLILSGTPSLANSQNVSSRDDAHPSPSAQKPVILPPFKLSPHLLFDLARGDKMTFLVLMTAQADLSHVAALPTKAAKGRAAYDALRAVARRTQAPLRAELDARGVSYQPFYIVNMLAVRGDASLALALAARPDVARLEANPAVRIVPPTDEPAQPSAFTPTATNGIEWGVSQVNADDVWELGYTGQGIVVAGQDTGYDWDHPALKAQYRGWNGTAALHDYNWHDAIHSGGGVCGPDSPEPCDDHGHGTHTMGTIVGDDGGGNQVGVAPGARWIGCRNMDRGVGTPLTYAECFQFFLAPYPIGGDPLTDGNPALAPHVVNNSWGCPPSEGCDVTSLRTAVENLRAAGILVVVSAGNLGSSCGSVQDPPALHDAAFTIGATNASDLIASFSSRGPVTQDGSDRPKPDVSAPGVSVRSSLPGGGYGYKSGTSMAAPHVSGLAALLWSAQTSLVGDVDLTEQIIRETARPVVDTTCGGDADGHPNNTYGWGIVDALGAVQSTTVSLGISATATPPWVLAGDVVTFTFTVSNAGRVSGATGVVLSDTLPLSTTFARASGGPVQTVQEVVWHLGTISPNHQVSTTLVVTVNSAALSGTLINNWRYQVRSDEILTPVTGLPVTVTVLQKESPVEVALGVAATATPEQVKAGDPVSFTFVVSNASPAPATGVILSDVLPLGTTFARASAPYSRTVQEVVWALGTLSPTQRVSVTLVVTVSDGLSSGTQISNADYHVRSNETPTPVIGPPATVSIFRDTDPVTLEVSAAVHPGWVRAGGVLSFTFTVSNVASAPATGVILSDVLPLGTTFAQAGGNYTNTGREVAWDLGTLYPAQQGQATLAVTVGVTVPPGTAIVNGNYGVRSQETGTLFINAPATALVAWPLFLPLVLNSQ